MFGRNGINIICADYLKIMADYFTQHLIQTYLYTVMLGLCVGSFLNVVIYRMPKILLQGWRNECAEMLELPVAANETTYQVLNLSLPTSHCPQCHHSITAWQNIPVLSFLWLKGRCYFCKARIAWRYPLVELVGALLALAAVVAFGVTLKAFAAMIFSWVMIVLIFIDIDYLILPDDLTLLLLWVGLLLSCLGVFITPRAAIIGASVGYGFLWMLARGVWTKSFWEGSVI